MFSFSFTQRNKMYVYLVMFPFYHPYCTKLFNVIMITQNTTTLVIRNFQYPLLCYPLQASS